MSTYISVIAGTAVTSTVTFQNPGVTSPVDPTTVTLKYRVSSGSVTTWEYEGAGSISKVSTGVYSAELDTTELPGSWVVEWVGTGDCSAVETAQFQVTPPPF
jgi:hypothetical protein